MAYQNVGTPVFYIDNYQYLRALGLNLEEYISVTEDVNNLSNITFKTPLDNESVFTLSPQNSKLMPRENGHTMRWFIPCGEMIRGMDFTGNMKWYGAILNHNLSDCNAGLHFSLFSGAIESENNTYSAHDIHFNSILNATSNFYQINNGSTIWTSDNVPTDERFTGFRLSGSAADSSTPTDLSNLQIGAVSMGVQYKMPKSPDLEISMKTSFDGLDKITTLGGATLSNVRHTGLPVWSNDGKFSNQFAVGEFSEDSFLNGAKRNGRREWEMTFNHIGDSDIFSSNYMNTPYTENTSDYESSDIDNSNQFKYNIFTDDSFIAQVWNKTLGGALPFIFQPDSNNNNPDQFCIAKFDMKELEINQVAFKVYEITLKIREIW
tara:strand:+ start:14942 stop:16075 length:1134 start_codon:yes stop_codon:yes gene_type:complete